LARSIAADRASIGADGRTIGVVEPSIAGVRRSIGVDQRTIGVDQRTIGVIERTIGVAQRSIGVDQPSIGVDARTIRAVGRSIRVVISFIFPDRLLNPRARRADLLCVGTLAAFAGAPCFAHVSQETRIMSANFLPTRDQDLDAWSANFDTRITATPTAFGILASDATAFHALAADFSAKLAAAVNPSTRTRVTVQAKDISRAALKSKARTLAKVINAYPPITNAQRADLGLTVRDGTPSPIPAPTTQPIVNIEGSGGGVSLLRLADETTPLKKAKPPGVFAALIYTKIDGPAPVTPADAQFSGVATKTLHSVNLPSGSAGKTLWVLAQWINERGENGPTSVVTSAMIAA
jgi:hypothetical protein